MTDKAQLPTHQFQTVLTAMVGLTLVGSALSSFYILVHVPVKGLYEYLFVLLDLIKMAGAILLFRQNKTGFYVYAPAEVLRTAILPILFARQTALSDFGIESSLAGKGTLFLFFSVIFGLIWIIGYGYFVQNPHTPPSEAK